MIVTLLLSLLLAHPAIKAPLCSVAFTDSVKIINRNWIYSGQDITRTQEQLLIKIGIDPNGVKYLGGEIEGSVFLLANKKEVVKVFHDKWYYDNAITASRLLDKHLRTVGFKTLSVYKTDPAKLLIYSNYVPGITLDLLFDRSDLTNRDKNRAFRRIRAMFTDLSDRVSKDKRIVSKKVYHNQNKMINYQGVYEALPNFIMDAKTTSDTAVINLHAGNIIVQMADNGSFGFIVIDYL